MISLTQDEWGIFRRLRRKHKVSIEFLRYNLSNIQKIIYYETWTRIRIKRYAIRKRNRVFLIHNRLKRVLFDQSSRRRFLRFRRNIRQWSKRMVAYKRRTKGTEEYVEEVLCTKQNTNSTNVADVTISENINATTSTVNVEDVSEQLKKQLQLLKSGRRQQPLIETKIPATIATMTASAEKKADTTTTAIQQQEKTTSSTTGEVVVHTADVNNQKSDTNLENIRNIIQDSIRLNNAKQTEIMQAQPAIVKDNHKKVADSSSDKTPTTPQDWQDQLEYTPEKQIVGHENVQPFKQLLATDEKTENSQTDEIIAQKVVKTGLNFLDMLMCKVSARQADVAKAEANRKINEKTSNDIVDHHEHSLDSTDEFLGFEESERLPGMLMTPIVPFSSGCNKNSIFVSEKLNEYMRANDLETDYNIDEDKAITRTKITHTDLEGLMTLKTQPPPFVMPAVPDNLLRFRTVAERRSYLSKFSKNYRLSIINNEANIYRELQKRMRYQKTKHSSQLVAQSASSSMSFTRIGWQTASFINTEFNKYYYQMLEVDSGKHVVRLKGVRGNNEELRKKPYSSTTKTACKSCRPHCIDLEMWQDFKPIQTVSPKSQKLNKGPLPAVFKPCPLSHKALQKPLDDDAAALLLAGGSMAVVRMPTVELEVFPECGRPLNEIAKQYLQYILPHHDISREWAEFSVSTLRTPGSLKDAVQAAADSTPRKSFTFLIPYLNDRNHVLVRRVVDRSEKLDQSFENSLESELVPKTDFTFRQNMDESDEILLECADVVSDMINTVAISCSENSFIKIDPDMLSEDKTDNIQLSPSTKLNRPPSSASNGPPTKKPAKQKRVLLELRRLNATIIDAAVKPEEEKIPCTKEYCAMGCICNSLTEESRLREHCGKAKCILECSCKASNQSRIMRLETDGRTITTEDAFMLRRKATARLARMEKEFTSTVVLTGNETLLINETNNDKKRRCTKLPKRYEYLDDSDDEPRTSPSKKTALTTIDNEKNLAIDVKELREPVYIKDCILEQMKHCSVDLVKLEDMDNVVPWCMVHHLYKCFCKCRALEGKPMVIEKDENNTTIEHGGEDDEHVEVAYKNNNTTKARYTFEKVEKNKKFRDEDEDNSGDDISATKYNDTRTRNRAARREAESAGSHQYSEDENKPDDGLTEMRADEQESTSDTNRLEKEKPQKRSLEDVRTRFYASRPESCRRQIPIPRRMFLYCNRKRRLNILKYIKSNETEKTRLLLNEHVMRSVYYHKIDNEKPQKRLEENNDAGGNKRKEKELQKVPEVKANAAIKKVQILKEKYVPVPEVVDLSADEEKLIKLAEQEQECNNTNELLTPLVSAQDVEQKKEIAMTTNAAQNTTKEGVITMKKFGTLSSYGGAGDGGAFSKHTEPNNFDKSDELKLPKISNCFSLNVKANLQSPQQQQQHQHLADFTSATSVYATAFNSSRSKNNAQQQQQQQQQLLLRSEMSDSPLDSSAQSPSTIECDTVRDVYNNVIRTMNSLVSKKMQDVDFALKRDSHIIPTPNADILCMMKWSNFLEAFCQCYAFIWQVKAREGTYLVATVRNMLPMICDALGVVNITALKPDKLPLMGKMLLQNLRNEHTAKLAVVMQGKQSYWVIKGFLKAEPTSACNKPTPETHPSLTKKINVLCTSLVKQRQKDEKHKEMVAQRWSAAPSKSAKVAQIMPTPRSQPAVVVEQQTQQQPAVAPIQQQQPPTVEKQSTMFLPPSSAAPSNLVNKIPNNSQISRKRKAPSDSVTTSSNGTIPSKMDSYAKMSTNIEFRKVTREDIDEIHLPETHKNNHKWLVLDLHSDFSHIFVPDFRDLVSLDRIQKVINFARQKNKIVKLQFFQNAPFDAFVTPKSGRKIYFGPLDLSMKPPTLILLQSVDGQMMLRELYQLKHSIQTSREEKTKAFWLLQMNGQTHFEVDTVASKELGNSVVPSSEMMQNQEENNTVQNIVNNENNANGNDDDDDDCMIIDEEQQISAEPEGRYNFTIAASQHNDKNIHVMPQTNSLPGPPPIQSLINTFKNSVTITSIEPIVSTSSFLQKIPHANTLIKPVLPITSVKPTTGMTNPPPSLPAVSTTINTSTLPPPNTINMGTLLPPNTIYMSTSTTSSATTTNVNMGNSFLKLPANAIITGIQPAPQEAPYSSTIFISSSPNKTNNTPFSNNTELSKNMPTNTMLPPAVPSEVITLTDDDVPAPEPSQPIAEKRRRISLVCHNPGYDYNSQSIAVNAVINKILPENIQDIQVNNSTSVKLDTTTVTVSSTIGSTTITKVGERPTTSYHQQQQLKSQDKGTTNNDLPIKPVVFDVSFVDGMDEPAASIVIKPTTPTKSTSSGTLPTLPTAAVVTNSTSFVTFSTGNVTPTVSKAISLSASCSTPTSVMNSLPVVPAPQPPIVSSSITTTQIQKFNIKNSNNRHIGYKVVRIPSNLASAMGASGNTGQTQTQTQILSKLLAAKSAAALNLTPTVSSTTASLQQRPLLPKTVLNSTNPIKIAPITPHNPITKAMTNSTTTMQPLENVIKSITITPVRRATIAAAVDASGTQALEAVKVLSPADLKSRCVTIRKIIPKPNAAEVLPSTTQGTILPATASLKPQTFAIPTEATASLSASSLSAVSAPPPPTLPPPTLPPPTLPPPTPSHPTPPPPTPPPPTPLPSTAAYTSVNSSTISPTASNNTLNTLNPPLAITSVQTLGATTTQKVPPSHIQYGYIVSSLFTDFKFVAKRVMEEFYVKVPSVGILKLMGLTSVNNYLNKHMLKSSEKNTNPGNWHFVAASKAIQIQNHQKSLMVRKTQSSTGSKDIPIKPRLIAPKPDSNKSQKVVNVTSMSEPILIDD